MLYIDPMDDVGRDGEKQGICVSGGLDFPLSLGFLVSDDNGCSSKSQRQS